MRSEDELRFAPYLLVVRHIDYDLKTEHFTQESLAQSAYERHTQILVDEPQGIGAIKSVELYGPNGHASTFWDEKEGNWHVTTCGSLS